MSFLTDCFRFTRQPTQITPPLEVKKPFYDNKVSINGNTITLFKISFKLPQNQENSTTTQVESQEKHNKITSVINKCENLIQLKTLKLLLDVSHLPGEAAENAVKMAGITPAEETEVIHSLNSYSNDNDLLSAIAFTSRISQAQSRQPQVDQSASQQVTSSLWYESLIKAKEAQLKKPLIMQPMQEFELDITQPEARSLTNNMLLDKGIPPLPVPPLQENLIKLQQDLANSCNNPRLEQNIIVQVSTILTTDSKKIDLKKKYQDALQEAKIGSAIPTKAAPANLPDSMTSIITNLEKKFEKITEELEKLQTDSVASVDNIELMPKQKIAIVKQILVESIYEIHEDGLKLLGNDPEKDSKAAALITNPINIAFLTNIDEIIDNINLENLNRLLKEAILDSWQKQIEEIRANLDKIERKETLTLMANSHLYYATHQLFNSKLDLIKQTLKEKIHHSNLVQGLKTFATKIKKNIEGSLNETMQQARHSQAETVATLGNKVAPLPFLRKSLLGATQNKYEAAKKDFTDNAYKPILAAYEKELKKFEQFHPDYQPSSGHGPVPNVTRQLLQEYLQTIQKINSGLEILYRIKTLRESLAGSLALYTCKNETDQLQKIKGLKELLEELNDYEKEIIPQLNNYENGIVNLHWQQKEEFLIKLDEIAASQHTILGNSEIALQPKTDSHPQLSALRKSNFILISNRISAASKRIPHSRNNEKILNKLKSFQSELAAFEHLVIDKKEAADGANQQVSQKTVSLTTIKKCSESILNIETKFEVLLNLYKLSEKIGSQKSEYIRELTDLKFDELTIFDKLRYRLDSIDEQLAKVNWQNKDSLLLELARIEHLIAEIDYNLQLRKQIKEIFTNVESTSILVNQASSQKTESQQPIDGNVNNLHVLEVQLVLNQITDNFIKALVTNQFRITNLELFNRKLEIFKILVEQLNTDISHEFRPKLIKYTIAAFKVLQNCKDVAAINNSNSPIATLLDNINLILQFNQIAGTLTILNNISTQYPLMASCCEEIEAIQLHYEKLINSLFNSSSFNDNNIKDQSAFPLTSIRNSEELKTGIAQLITWINNLNSKYIDKDNLDTRKLQFQHNNLQQLHIFYKEQVQARFERELAELDNIVEGVLQCNHAGALDNALSNPLITTLPAKFSDFAASTAGSHTVLVGDISGSYARMILSACKAKHAFITPRGQKIANLLAHFEDRILSAEDCGAGIDLLEKHYQINYKLIYLINLLEREVIVCPHPAYSLQLIDIGDRIFDMFGIAPDANMFLQERLNYYKQFKLYTALLGNHELYNTSAKDFKRGEAANVLPIVKIKDRFISIRQALIEKNIIIPHPQLNDYLNHNTDTAMKEQDIDMHYLDDKCIQFYQWLLKNNVLAYHLKEENAIITHHGLALASTKFTVIERILNLACNKNSIDGLIRYDSQSEELNYELESLCKELAEETPATIIKLKQLKAKFMPLVSSNDAITCAFGNFSLTKPNSSNNKILCNPSELCDMINALGIEGATETDYIRQRAIPLMKFDKAGDKSITLFNVAHSRQEKIPDLTGFNLTQSQMEATSKLLAVKIFHGHNGKQIKSGGVLGINDLGHTGENKPTLVYLNNLVYTVPNRSPGNVVIES